MIEPIYQLRSIAKEYNGRRVLHVERLDIHRGEIFALVGPSGAGKSTLLRLLNFLEPPASGSIHFLGAEFNVSQPMPLRLRRRVTTVFQRGQRDAARQIQMALEQVGLGDLARERARTLSGGEAQRVALARAMVLQPEVLLLDEPTANLDPYNVGLIEDIVRSLNRERGTTLVLVTHNVFQARRLADRVALLLEGHIVEVAGVDSFFQSPRDPRTAAFVRGEMVY